jgi:hypothetical protein
MHPFDELTEADFLPGFEEIRVGYALLHPTDGSNIKQLECALETFMRHFYVAHYESKTTDWAGKKVVTRVTRLAVETREKLIRILAEEGRRRHSN